MSEPLYFHDNARRAAEHLLDGQFGARLRQLADVEVSEAHGYLMVDPANADDYLSSGECVLLDVLISLASGPGRVHLTDLDRLDDGNWDRVIAALFIARGRVMAASS